MKPAESGWALMSCRCEINDKRQEGEEVDGVRKSFLNRRETMMEQNINLTSCHQIQLLAGPFCFKTGCVDCLIGLVEETVNSFLMVHHL